MQRDGCSTPEVEAEAKAEAEPEPEAQAGRRWRGELKRDREAGRPPGDGEGSGRRCAQTNRAAAATVQVLTGARHVVVLVESCYLRARFLGE